MKNAKRNINRLTILTTVLLMVSCLLMTSCTVNKSSDGEATSLQAEPANTEAKKTYHAYVVVGDRLLEYDCVGYGYIPAGWRIKLYLEDGSFVYASSFNVTIVEQGGQNE